MPETMTRKLFHKFNAPPKVKVPAGDPIYKYKYRDKKTGEMKEQTINMQEKIQSYLSQVDYKKRIELGLGLEAPIESGLHSDFTQLPDNTVDILNLVRNLGSLSQDQITNILQQVSGTVQTKPESGQATVQSAGSVEQTPPASSTTDQAASGSGGE